MLINNLIVITFGLIVGSFVSACAFRIPYGREKGPPNLDLDDDEEEDAEESDSNSSPVAPPEISFLQPKRSICPECRTQLKWYHNIPLFSWIYLGGKCASCEKPISIRYPLTEIASALLAVISYQVFGATPTAFLVYIFSAVLLLISIIDIEYYIIPDVISIPGTFVALAIALANQFLNIFGEPISPTLIDGLLGVLAGGGFLFFVAVTFITVRGKQGLGLGDVKLLALTGGLLGWQAAFYTIFVGSLLGSVIGVVLLSLKGFGLNKPLPFGPYLALATVLYMFTGLDLLIALRMGMMHLFQPSM